MTALAYWQHQETFTSWAITQVGPNQRSKLYFSSKLKEHRFSLPIICFGREQCIFLMKPFFPLSNLPYVEAQVS
jgi:hypothetical protein